MLRTFLLSLATLPCLCLGSQLTVFNATTKEPLFYSDQLEEIQTALQSCGLYFEHWTAEYMCDDTTTIEQIEKAYQRELALLQKSQSFAFYDIVRIQPSTPSIDMLRQKFLNEHTHDEPEIRFFVEGSGLFYLHIEDKVLAVLCEKGDLISIPKDTPHWFDMGHKPQFTAIRLFTKKEGWIAYPTHSNIADFFTQN